MAADGIVAALRCRQDCRELAAACRLFVREVWVRPESIAIASVEAKAGVAALAKAGVIEQSESGEWRPALRSVEDAETWYRLRELFGTHLASILL